MRMAMLVILLLAGTGPDARSEPPRSIDVRSGDMPLISSGVIPIPLEIFAALDKMGVRDWNRQIERRNFDPRPDRARSALIFGLAISQGFMAVQAENIQEVQHVGRSVQNLAGPLGVGEAVEGRLKIILEQLNERDWDGVKRELDRTRQTVLSTMRSMRDDELASLVALGGWLGGTEAVSSLLNEEYSPESSDLLNQAGLLERLRIEFAQLPSSLKKDRLFVRIDAALQRLEELMETDTSGVVSREKVGKIFREAHSLVEAIHEG